MNFYKSQNLIFWKKVFSKPNSVHTISQKFRENNGLTKEITK